MFGGASRVLSGSVWSSNLQIDVIDDDCCVKVNCRYRTTQNKTNDGIYQRENLYKLEPWAIVSRTFGARGLSTLAAAVPAHAVHIGCTINVKHGDISSH